MIGRTIAIVIFLIGSLWVFTKVFSLTYPFWFAALFAWMLQPVARFFQQKLRFSRGFASLFGLLGGILVISAILTGLVFLIYFSLRQFFEQVPTWIEEGSEKMQIFFNETIWPYWQQVLGLFDTIDVGTHNVLSEGIDQLGTVLGNFLGDIGQGLLTF